jgi:cobalamin biosynthesis Mg chelatase CobN
MKKILIILLIPTLLSCSALKKINKEKAKEETKEIAVSKLDSINETKIEDEIVSTFISDSTANTLDLSTETTTILFNDSGLVKSIVTTKKNNIKSNGTNKSKRQELAKKHISKLSSLKKVQSKKNTHNVSTSKKTKEVKKDSTKSWFWIIVGLVFSAFILVAIMKVKNKYF